MARFSLFYLLSLCVLGGTFAAATGPRKLILVQPPLLVLSYHNGFLLKGNLTLHLLFYGTFSTSQKAIITDFVRSLTPSSTAAPPLAPSVVTWWRTTERYRGGATRVSLGRQISDTYSLGKSLTSADIQTLAQRGPHSNAITAVLTAPDVTVAGFCMSRCGSHASAPVPTGNRKTRFTYLWVGNLATQCPGQCAWPFHQPIYGPQGPPLVSPNGDVGVDGMIINLASVLAGAVTNPYGKGYFQGPMTAPLEAVTACTGAFGKGAYPGYPGDVAVDPASGASYMGCTGGNISCRPCGTPKHHSALYLCREENNTCVVCLLFFCL